MTTDIKAIKREFLQYLIDNEKITEKEKAEFNTNLSIFKYLSDFSKFFQENKAILDLPEDFKGSITDIMKLEFGSTEEDNDVYSGVKEEEAIKNNSTKQLVLETTYNKQEKTKNVIKNC